MNANWMLFVFGAVLLGYDIAGHATCLVCRLTGRRGARWWNTHSQKIWPRLEGVNYDLHWTAWHSVALGLMTIAYLTK